MTDEIQQANTALAQLGARLKAARETMQLTDKDAASRLHLSTKFITMMESGNYDSSLPMTFLRGYIRSYAKLLNISDDPILSVLDQLETSRPTVTPVTPMQHVLLKTTSIKKTDRYIRWGTYIIVIALIGLVITWWNSHARYSVSDIPPVPTAETEPKAPPIPAPLPTEVTPMAAPLATPPTQQTPVPIAPNTTPTPLAVPTDNNTTPPAAAPNTSTPDAKPKKRRATNKLPMVLHEPGLEEEPGPDDSDFNSD